VSALEISLLIAVGLVAGVVNTLAGGGSLLTVPLLVILGLPGTIANGTNRVGVLVQCLVACWRFDAEGISEFRRALPVLPPIVLGSIVGAVCATRIPDLLFEQIFAGIMLVLLIPMLRGAPLPSSPDVQRWSPLTRNIVLFAVGIYGGAVQAGVGLLLLFALNRAGYDLVRANAIKIVVVTALVLASVPIFVFEHQVAWLPAAFVSIGFTLGAALGARIAVVGGETAIRRALAIAVFALAGHLFGLY
jgi:uncharacterized membrane protein YfcA